MLSISCRLHILNLLLNFILIGVKTIHIKFALHTCSNKSNVVYFRRFTDKQNICMPFELLMCTIYGSPNRLWEITSLLLFFREN